MTDDNHFASPNPASSDDETGTVMWWAVLPSAWMRHAARLRRSAQQLWQPLDHALMLKPPFSKADLALWDHSYAFLLVAGASLEAMFKAVAIQAAFNDSGFDGILTPKKQLQGWLRTHKLVKLAERANISLAEDEVGQLERFTKYITWAGSYPVPIDIRDQRPNAVLLFDLKVSEVDRISFDRLYGRAVQSHKEHLREFNRRYPTQRSASDGPNR